LYSCAVGLLHALHSKLKNKALLAHNAIQFVAKPVRVYFFGLRVSGIAQFTFLAINADELRYQSA